MAHEDVVPVNPGTLNQWTYPPFEGVVDGEWVWGRGAADCKNQVGTAGLLEAGWVERLIPFLNVVVDGDHVRFGQVDRRGFPAREDRVGFFRIR